MYHAIVHRLQQDLHQLQTEMKSTQQTQSVHQRPRNKNKELTQGSSVAYLSTNTPAVPLSSLLPPHRSRLLMNGISLTNCDRRYSTITLTEFINNFYIRIYKNTIL